MHFFPSFTKESILTLVPLVLLCATTWIHLLPSRVASNLYIRTLSTTRACNVYDCISGPHPFQLHMMTWEFKEILSSYTEVLLYIASMAGLERPYKESVGLRKQLFCPKVKVITRTNFMVGRLINKKKKMENWPFVRHCSGAFDLLWDYCRVYNPS